MQAEPELGVGWGQVGVQPQCVQVGGPGIDGPTQRPQGVAQVIMNGREVRLKPGCLLAVRQCCLSLASVEEHLTKIASCGCETRIQLDGAVKVFQRLIEPAQFPQDDAEVVVDRSEV